MLSVEIAQFALHYLSVQVMWLSEPAMCLSVQAMELCERALRVSELALGVSVQAMELSELPERLPSEPVMGPAVLATLISDLAT